MSLWRAKTDRDPTPADVAAVGPSVDRDEENEARAESTGEAARAAQAGSAGGAASADAAGSADVLGTGAEDEKAGTDVVRKTDADHGGEAEAEPDVTEVHERTIWNRFTGFLSSNHTFFQWVVVVLVLGLWGAWAGPGWDPKPMTTLVVPETSDTTVHTAVPTADLGDYEFTVSDHELVLASGETITMRLRMPVDAGEDVPGMVLMHGTGTDSHEAFVEHGEWLASAGIATLVPDKPLDQYSTLSRNYEELAEAYTQAANWLRTVDGVMSRSVGYLGESEGALVAPISAVADPRTSYVVLISDPAIPIRQQGALAADSYLRNIGAPIQVIRAVPRLISGAIADGEFLYANFDPGPYHEQMTMPVFMAYGTADLSMPVIQGPVEMREQLAKAGNDQLLVRYYADADHGLRVDKEILRQPFQDISDFINGLPQSVYLSPAVAGAQPRQDYVAPTVETPRWFGSSTAMLIILMVALLLTVTAIVIAVVGQIRWKGRRLIDFKGVGHQLVISNAGIIVAWVAFIAYVLILAESAMSFEGNRWVIQGGWLLLQGLGLLAAWRFVVLVNKWRDKPRMSRWATAVIHLSIVGQALLLLSLAYWGVFPSIV